MKNLRDLRREINVLFKKLRMKEKYQNYRIRFLTKLLALQTIF